MKNGSVAVGNTEMSEGKHSNRGTLAFSLGFGLMILDMALS